MSSLTPAEIEEERQRRRKCLESLRKKRLQEESAYKADERRRQDQIESYQEQAHRVREDLDRQLRAEAVFCPCFVA